MVENFVSGLSVPIQLVIFSASLVVGAFCLIKFCNIFVDSSSTIAKFLGISPLIIGLTVVAIGTSFPELAVSISDSIFSIVNGSNANIGFSNVVGSNISNLLLVLAFSGLFSPLIIKRETRKDYAILLFITLLLAVFGFFFGITSFVGGSAILRWEAIILVILIFFYIIYIVKNSKKSIESVEDINSVDKQDESKIIKYILLTILGIGGIAIGGELVVYGAKGIALNISSALSVDKDVAESLIGLTIVAVGTSLPELVTTIIASKKKENEMALGNVIGSNIFNIIFVLGISATIAPFTISSYMLVDLLVMVIATFIVLIFVIKGKLAKKESVLLLIIYVTYVIYLILRTLL